MTYIHVDNRVILPRNVLELRLLGTLLAKVVSDWLRAIDSSQLAQVPSLTISDIYNSQI